MTKRKAPSEKISLQDEDWEVDLLAKMRSDQRGFVVAPPL